MPGPTEKSLGSPYLFFQFQGGCDTRREKTVLPMGAYSMVQNMRSRYPGMKKRPGMIRLHPNNEGSNQVMTLFQMSKGGISERHTFAQMSDGKVYEADNDPPTVSDTDFGDSVYTGTSGQVPASWSMMRDCLIFSNGADQHQLYAGSEYPITAFVVCKESGAIPLLPTKGADYTVEATDGDSATEIVLDALGDLGTDYDCIFICTQLKSSAFNFTFSIPNADADAIVKVNYWNGTWAAATVSSDTTMTGIYSFAQDGKVSINETADEIPTYMYGVSGYWYQVYLGAGGDLSATCRATSCTYDTRWQALENVWDGVPLAATEAQFYDQSQSAYMTYPYAAVTLGGMTTSDKCYISSPWPLTGFYIDVGETPNVNSASVDHVYYWNGTAFAEVSGRVDGTSGATKTGWITFDREAAFKTQFNNTQYYAYWYYFTVSATLSADAAVSIYTMPYFDINEIGRAGVCNGVWKDRAVYTFGKEGNYLYVSAANRPNVLNGSDTTVLQAGDGRKNNVVAVRKFYNELMVWQEEKGTNGGCLTLFEGYSPATFAKLVLSNQIGTFNSKSVAVVDGVHTEQGAKTIAYFLSHQGVMACDGTTVYRISDKIGNYFDPDEDECIRRGYESQMWLEHDQRYNIIRCGLVSGSDATVPNVFPVYDIQSREWSFDSLPHPLSCMANVESEEDANTILQIGGGTGDGYIYLLNYGLNDVDDAVDAYVTMELDHQGFVMHLTKAILRTKSQDGGTCQIDVYEDGVLSQQKGDAVDLDPAVVDALATRNKRSMNLIGDHLSIKFQNNGVGKDFYLLDVSLALSAFMER